MDPKLLGQRIKEARLAKKMTQTEVVGSFITRNMLSQIESGNAVPSVKTLTYLAQVLELPPSVLLPDTAEGTEASGAPDISGSAVTVPADAATLYKAKEAYLAGNDTEAYELLSSIEEKYNGDKRFSVSTLTTLSNGLSSNVFSYASSIPFSFSNVSVKFCAPSSALLRICNAEKSGRCVK